jgi:DNA gyrase subunit B
MAKKEQKVDNNKGSASYGAKDIFVLEGLEPVRKRPGMYIGSTGSQGLHHLIWEVVDNSIDEAMAGFAKNVTVELLPGNKVSVVDDGRGIPVDTHAQTKKSALETVLTTLHAGGKFGGDSYKVSGGLHGVGVSVVNALSVWMKVEVERDGGKYEQEYKRGKPEYKVRKVGASKNHGTKVTFSPDGEIFSELEFNDKTILDHLRQTAYLTKGVRVNFFDRRGPVPIAHGFYFEGGVLSFIKFLARGKNHLQEEIFYVEKEYMATAEAGAHGKNPMDIEVAFLYVDDTRVQELSFANNEYTVEGGMHLTGFRSALTRTINNYARAEGYLKEKEENITSDDMREGLVSVVSIKLREPQFEGQTKAKLGNPEARTATETVVNEAFKEYMEKHPQDAKAIVAKVILTSKARLAAKAARDTVLRKGAFEGLTLPGKLADCISKSAAESELFIVEGDSAGGTAKQGRNRQTQAILPLRGKILNVERARLDRMLANTEIRALVVAIGTAIGEEFSIEKLRYHKIVIMTDADVDGAHIRTLLLTLFYRYFRPVVDGGFIYIAQPPLYKIQSGKTVEYAYSDDQKDKIIAEITKNKQQAAKNKSAKAAKKEAEVEIEIIEGDAGELAGSEGTEKKFTIDVQRYKGLGEMSDKQLWETTMNPEKRLMKQVTVDDASMADKLFDILMGDAVEPRKNFIQAHAGSVENLDI